MCTFSFLEYLATFQLVLEDPYKELQRQVTKKSNRKILYASTFG